MNWGFSQSARDTMVVSKNSKIVTSSRALENSLYRNSNELEMASNYRTLAYELNTKGNYLKAENYLNSAINIYKSNKQTELLAQTYRELAKVQEAQGKIKSATENYNNAAKYSKQKNERNINLTDVKRLENNSNPKEKLVAIEEKIQNLNDLGSSAEKSEAYSQAAEANLEMKNEQEAVQNLNQALLNTRSNSSQVEIKNKLTDVYVDIKQYDKAIEIQKGIVQEAEKGNDINTQIVQLQKLSDVYFETEKKEEGFKVLQKAYQMALEKSNLKEAKNSLLLLVAQLEKNKEQSKILPLYKEFILKLDTLIKSDSNIVDMKLFQVSEEKIQQLEKEKVLKDELIERKSKFNYVLIGSLILMFGLFFIIVKAWNSIRKRNKKIALQSLRREMNPHFIFNSLNSVNNFIASNNELAANKFLNSYSNLMRTIMENSNKDFISLSTEIEQIKKYLELEKLRFSDKFEYQIEVDENIDIDSEKVPNMIIQPNLENAIWHGLRYKESKGILKLIIKKEGAKMQVFIDDNGIGLKRSQEIKTKNQKMHESRGLKNVEERIKLLNEIYKLNIHFEVIEKPLPDNGVIIKIEW
jgi:tetratricopeptide (TPR) repeat protein